MSSLLMPAIVLIMAVFLAGSYFVAARIGKQQEKRSRILAVIAHKGVGKEENKDKQLAKQRADIAKKLKEAGRESKDKDKVSTREMMQQAGIEGPVSQYWIASALLAGLVYIAVSMTSWPAIAKMFVTFTAFLGIPKLILSIAADRRQRKFLEDFSDALDAMVRLLQAGMPVSEAIAMTSREFTGPLKEEMTRIYENQKIGTPLGEAALMMAKRVPLTEAHMFATALQIQSETGSSLSEVLSNLSSVIRARFRLKRKVKALSSEAKASAAIIAALPILVSLGLYLVNPDYIGILFTTPKGKVYLTGAIIWMSIGILIMRQMINFKV